MASYRDQKNPEALHFPGSLASRSFSAGAIFFCLGIIAGLAWIGSQFDRTVVVAIVFLVVLMAMGAWPKEILLNQNGLTQRRMGIRHLVAWQNVGSVETGTEFRLPFRAGRFPTRTIRVTSKDGRQVVLHTPRHTDLQRFIFEVQKHGIALPHELSQIGAPSQVRLSSAKDPMPENLRLR